MHNAIHSCYDLARVKTEVGPKNLLLSNLEFCLSLKSVVAQLKISSLTATEVECRYQQNVSFLY